MRNFYLLLLLGISSVLLFSVDASGQCTKPTITLGPTTSKCSGTSVGSMSYSASTGAPDKYRIVWDAAAIAAGFQNVPLKSLPPLPPILPPILPELISFNIPTTEGTYSGILFVMNSTTGCESSGYPINTTINSGPLITVTPSAPSVCAGSLLLLTASSAGPGPYVWSEAGQPVFIGYKFTAWGTTTKTYTVKGGDCLHTTDVTVTVIPRPKASITSPAAEICKGASTIISGTVTAVGNWTLTLTNGESVSGSGNGTWTKSVSPTSTTTYYIASLVDENCSSISSSDFAGSETVTIKPEPSAWIHNASETICNGSTILIWGSVTTSGDWTMTLSSGDQITGQGGSAVHWDKSISPSSNTIYTIASIVDQCSSISTDVTGSVTVTVKTRPKASITSPDVTICNDGRMNTITGTVTAVGNWSLWLSDNNTTGYQVTGNGSGTWSKDVSSNSSRTYTINSLGDTQQCNSNSSDFSGSEKITVINYPNAAITSSNTTICNEGSAIVSGTITAAGNWALTLNNGGGSITGTGSTWSKTVSPSSTTTYTIASVAVGNCSAPVNYLTGSEIVTVNPSTVITVQPSTTPQTVCQNGATTPLTIAATGTALSYQWYSSNTSSNTGGTLISNNATSSSYNPPSTSSGKKYYYATVSGSCGALTSSVSGAVIVNPLPTVTADPKQVCSGSSVELTGTPAGGVWSGTNVSGSTFNSTGLAAGNYSVTYTYTNSNNCTNSATTLVTVNSLPTVTADPKQVCSGSSVSLTGTPAGGTWSGTGVSGSTFNSVGLAIGEYSVTYTYTNSSNCTNSATAVVTVNSLPTVMADPKQVCSGSSVVLTGTPSGGVWSGTNVSGSTFNSIGLTAGSYFVTYTYTTSNNCTNSATPLITVNPLPIVTADSKQVCSGGSVALTGTPSGGVWSGTGVSGSTFNSTGLTAGSYFVTYTYSDGNNCSNSATAKVTVNLFPTPTIIGSSSVCQGTSVSYSTQTGMIGYAWIASPGGTITSGQGTSAVQVSWTASGSKTISVTYSNNGCAATTPTVKNVTVLAAPKPALSATYDLCIYGYEKLTATNATGVTNYTWSTGQTTTLNNIKVYTSGTYNVRANYSNGCTATSYSIYVDPCGDPCNPNTIANAREIEPCPQLLKESSITEPVAYPNPAKGKVTVRIPNTENDTPVYLVNQFGQTMKSQVILKGTDRIEFSVEDMVNGIYLIHINRVTLKVLITN